MVKPFIVDQKYPLFNLTKSDSFYQQKFEYFVQVYTHFRPNTATVRKCASIYSICTMILHGTWLIDRRKLEISP